MKPFLAWALVAEDGNPVEIGLRAEFVAFRRREDAWMNASPGERIVRVEIRPVKAKRKGKP